MPFYLVRANFMKRTINVSIDEDENHFISYIPVLNTFNVFLVTQGRAYPFFKHRYSM